MPAGTRGHVIVAEYDDVAAGLLGRNYTISGEVVKGAGRGRTIGFPTANVVPFDRDKVVPKDGVYAVRVTINRETVKGGMLNIGTNPTFASTERTIEVNIFDLDADLYGKSIEVDFVERLREEVRYASVKELVAQLERDRITALEALDG